MALQNRRRQRERIEGAELWEREEIDEKFAALQATPTEKINHMKLQWQWWKKKAIESSEKSRSFPNMPQQVSPEQFKEALKEMFQCDIIGTFVT